MEYKEKQRYLNQLGYGPIKEDGFPGNETKTAAMKFQMDNGLKPDGVIGIDTTAKMIEVAKKINLDSFKVKLSDKRYIEVSRTSIDLIISSEISDKEYYNKFLQRPTYPGAASGITIGFGYDLGYNTVAQIEKDWGGILPRDTVKAFKSVAELKGNAANDRLSSVRNRYVSWDAAFQVFTESTLPRFAKDLYNTYHGVENLYPDASGGLLGLVFNRGTDLTDSDTDRNQRRKEMRAIAPLVTTADYLGIANQVKAMKRLWDGVPNFDGAKEERLNGLLIRRNNEANLILNAKREYKPEELVRIYFAA